VSYDPEKHHRCSIRLKDYDYSQAGAYFMTVCAWNKECIFGEIKDGEILFNEYGKSVMKCWDAIPSHFINAECDEFVVMPNHIHGIITISNVGAQFIAPSCINRQTSHRFKINQNNKKGVMNHAPTLGGIVRSFKARCTYMINQIRNTSGIPVWQRNYYEHVIRTEKELNQIREYIVNNPMRWELDTENPQYIEGSKSRNV
jgi:REP element-mobilizing transposase RayT